MVKKRHTAGNRIISNNIRSIRRSFTRFVSLLIMSFLGVFVFAGLMATAPDMLITLDRYLDRMEVYDIKVVSDGGLTEEDAEKIAEAAGVEKAEAGQSLDAIVHAGDGEAVVSFISMPKELNRIELTGGRLPQNCGEVLVEDNFLKLEGLSIGDDIEIDTDELKDDALVIVGTVKSPLFYNNVSINQTRGNTGVGSGTVKYYAYMPLDNYDRDYYSCIYVKVSGADELDTSQEDYETLVDKTIDAIEDIKEDRCAKRYESILSEAEDALAEAEAEADEELDEAKEKLDDAKAELDDNKAKLDDAREELDEAKEELDSVKEELDEGKAKLDEVRNAVSTSSDGTDAGGNSLGAGDFSEEDVEAFRQGTISYREGFKEYQAAYKEYSANETKYSNGMLEYERGLEAYREGLSKYNEKKAEADDKIADAKEEIAQIKMPKWYVNDRSGYSVYSDYVDDSNSIRNLAKLFPVVFYLVSVLVSLISMSRMVEDDRLEIGTMKSLGYEKGVIMSKYLFFAFAATLIGGLLGLLGVIVIPNLIFYIYKILFDLPELAVTLQPLSSFTGYVITVICVCGTSVMTAAKVLKEKPASLMRPKSPKGGRTNVLEKIPFIWKRLSFTGKVTVRNIFRYKKRILITIGGIAGCTALILTGFGIRDSIVDLPSAQYEQVFTYDAIVYITEDADKDEITGLAEQEITGAAAAKRVTAELDGYEGYIMAVEDAAGLEKIADFKDEASNEPVRLTDDAVITDEKLSAMAGIHPSDTLNIITVDNDEYDMKVSAVVTNYVEHFAIMTADCYEAAGGDFIPNILFLKLDPEALENKDALSEKLLANDNVLSVVYTSSLIDSVGDGLKSLNYVVMILIVLSAMLAFVVLYNLSAINISERKREIATLKVLGFYDNEVDAYINREMVFVTVCGIILGLAAGFVLSKAVVGTIEIEKCRFINKLKPISYCCAAAMSAAFTFIMNKITHFTLKKIDMIESLKSVE